MLAERTAGLDAIVESMLRTARVPGAALAVVAAGRVVFAKGYGYRDLHAKLPMQPDTLYPIGSTTKAMNATLLGMLVDAGELEWDAPVQKYLPGFRLADPGVSAQVTMRDLVTMRTGLPRHDWLWLGNPMSRATLVERMRHLQLSAGFRERFQYNNLTIATAGYVAEVITGLSWGTLVQQKLLDPLEMRSSHTSAQPAANATCSYHEVSDRNLALTAALASETVAPAGGSLYSTVEDMAHWLTFNLTSGNAGGRQLIEPQTLQEIFTPQVLTGRDPTAPSPGAAYAMGWFVDTYNGCARVSHGGYLQDVHSSISLFPAQGIGIVAVTNFGCPRLARLLTQQVFDSVQGVELTETLQQKLAQYEQGIEKTREDRAAARRAPGTSPSYSLDDYAGHYEHPGYGALNIRRRGQALVLERGDLQLPLEHWHYDAWRVASDDMFGIHEPHPFIHSERLLFEMNVDGEIAALSAQLEPAVEPIRFKKAPRASPVISGHRPTQS